MKRLLVALAAMISVLLVSGCDIASPTMSADEMNVKRVEVADTRELEKFCGNSHVIGELGCATGGAMSTPRQDKCIIYYLKPKGYDDHRLIETMGHELKHCYEGPVHT